MPNDLYPDYNEKKLDMLKGKTLEVYYLLAKNIGKRYGVRQVQREMNYSSSSVAAYHLNRLLEHGLIKKTPSGLYYIEGDPVKLGRLEDHIVVAGKYIPRILFYLYHAVLMIIVAAAFYILDVSPLMWLSYVILSNVVFVVILLRDAKKILSKLSSFSE